MNNNEVTEAFGMLLEEIETLVRGLDNEGAEAFRAGDHDRAGRLAEQARRISELHEKVKSLRREWQSISAGKAPRRERGRKKHLGGLPEDVAHLSERSADRSWRPSPSSAAAPR